MNTVKRKCMNCKFVFQNLQYMLKYLVGIYTKRK